MFISTNAEPTSYLICTHRIHRYPGALAEGLETWLNSNGEKVPHTALYKGSP